MRFSLPANCKRMHRDDVRFSVVTGDASARVTELSGQTTAFPVPVNSALILAPYPAEWPGALPLPAEQNAKLEQLNTWIAGARRIAGLLTTRTTWKSETRNPKSETSPKPEFRNPQAAAGWQAHEHDERQFRLSVFGFPSDFDIRISDFQSTSAFDALGRPTNLLVQGSPPADRRAGQRTSYDYNGMNQLTGVRIVFVGGGFDGGANAGLRLNQEREVNAAIQFLRRAFKGHRTESRPVGVSRLR
jgi:hypothetical protein